MPSVVPKEGPDSAGGSAPSTVRPHVQGAPLTDAERAEAIRRLKAGESYGRIGKALGGVSKVTLWKIKREAESSGVLPRRSPLPAHAPAPSNGHRPEVGPRARSDPFDKSNGGKRMADDDHDRVLRLEMQAEQERAARQEDRALLKSIAEQTRRATLQPPKVELHDGRIAATCPNCERTTEVAAPRATLGVRDFDDVISMLDANHQEAPGGHGTWQDCPSCKPKMDAKLKGWGYERVAGSEPAQPSDHRSG